MLSFGILQENGSQPPGKVPLQVLLPLLPAKVEDGKDLQGGSCLACRGSGRGRGFSWFDMRASQRSLHCRISIRGTPSVHGLGVGIPLPSARGCCGSSSLPSPSRRSSWWGWPSRPSAPIWGWVECGGVDTWGWFRDPK